MPNLNYAQVWEPELLEILMQGTLTSPFVTSNVKWLDAKTFHFTQMSTSGYKNHNRNGGWNKGDYTQKDVPFTLTHDRDISFLVDKADVDETNATASIQNISRTFEQTQVVPETDALFFAKVAQVAQKAEGYHSATAAATYTKAKVFGMLKDILANPVCPLTAASYATRLFIKLLKSFLAKTGADTSRKPWLKPFTACKRIFILLELIFRMVIQPPCIWRAGYQAYFSARSFTGVHEGAFILQVASIKRHDLCLYHFRMQRFRRLLQSNYCCTGQLADTGHVQLYS